LDLSWAKVGDSVSGITVYVYPSNKRIDISGMMKTVTWTGDINTLPRSLEVEFKNTNDINDRKQLIQFAVGNFVVAYSGTTEIFRGNIFQTKKTQNGDSSFTAFDELVYLTKNETSMLIKKQKASQVVSSLASKFGVKFSRIDDTGYVIAKEVCQNTAASDIINTVLEDTKKGNGKSYTITSRKGVASLIARENASKITVTVDNVITAEQDVSIEDTRTQVVITKGQLDAGKGDTKFSSVTVSDSAARNAYGLMQHSEEINDDKATTATMKSKANEILKTLKDPTYTLSMEFYGDINCTTGNRIGIHDPLSGMEGLYYITQDSHTWDSGEYKMQLQISKKLT
jgi:hypothetical protein